MNLYKDFWIPKWITYKWKIQQENALFWMGVGDSELHGGVWSQGWGRYTAKVITEDNTLLNWLHTLHFKIDCIY